MKAPSTWVGKWMMSLLLLGTAMGYFLVLLASSPVPYSTPVELGGRPDFAPATPAGLAGTEGVPVVSLAFVGDIMQHREQAEDDFFATYGEVSPLLQDYDLVVGNLEFPVDPLRPVGPPPGSARFNGSEEHLSALAAAGIGLVTTANNHAFDQGLQGVLSTLRHLDGIGLESFGTGAEEGDLGPKILSVGPLRIAFVGYTFPPNIYLDSADRPVPWPRDWPINDLYFDDWTGEYREEGLASFRRHMNASRNAEADFTIAFVHWGEEWSYAPNRHQRLAARDMIEAGFDLVVGSHSHVLNPAEVVDGKLVAYSLGNFVSAFWQAEVRTGAVLEVTLVMGEDGRVSVGDFAFRPVFTQGLDHIVMPVQAGATGGAGRALSTARRIVGDGALRPFPPAEFRPTSSSRPSGSPPLSPG